VCTRSSKRRIKQHCAVRERCASGSTLVLTAAKYNYGKSSGNA
jgi:hypothetical protein